MNILFLSSIKDKNGVSVASNLAIAAGVFIATYGA